MLENICIFCLDWGWSCDVDGVDGSENSGFKGVCSAKALSKFCCEESWGNGWSFADINGIDVDASGILLGILSIVSSFSVRFSL